MKKRSVALMMAGLVILTCSGCLKTTNVEKTTKETTAQESQETITESEAEMSAQTDLEKQYGTGDDEYIKYYTENGELLSVVEAESSTNVQTEKEVYEDFLARGFDQSPITSDYKMDGTYYSPIEIEKDSNEKHPSYTTTYTSTTNDVWSIVSLNGVVIANPITYNLINAETGQTPYVTTVYSETDSIDCYESNANCFYIVIPNDDALMVKKLDKIDAEALNQFSFNADYEKTQGSQSGAQEVSE